jgi:hypothetical protein
MYDFRFYQACKGQTQLVYKVGWGTIGFIGENLRRAKGLILFLFIFPLSRVFYYYYGVSIGIRSG